MKYKCLILDHDDTTVNSTPFVHYPAFQSILRELRPGLEVSMKQFLSYNFTPGLRNYYRQELNFSDEELERETKIWQDFLYSVRPDFFPGMKEIILRQKQEGGFCCVVSHSYPDVILRDYHLAGLPEPDALFGFDPDRSKCKPNPYPVEQIEKITGCGRDEMLMVDDSRPGFEMARNTGIAFAGCGWGVEVPMIRDFMLEHADHYFTDVSQLESLLFQV